MKKFFLTMMALIAIFLSVHAAHVTVNFKAGHTIEGDLKYRDDTTIVMTPYYYGDKKALTIKPEEVKDFTISGLGHFYAEEGKFVPDAKTQAKLEKKQAQAREYYLGKNHLSAADPNEVIGRALKSTGATAIGFGIPSLLAGTILMGIGYSNAKLSNNTIKNVEKHDKCKIAGCVLMSTGAALTIVGVPLYVHGKRIADFNVNYTGTGAGVSVKF